MESDFPEFLTGEQKAPTARKPYEEKLYSVPRRYDLGTLFAVLMAFSLLFGGMRLIGMPGEAVAFVAGFISCVGVAQALLFKGKSPRAASVLAGAMFALISDIITHIIFEQYPLIFIPCTAILGAGLGYVAGVFVGGVFLVADAIRRGIRSFW